MRVQGDGSGVVVKKVCEMGDRPRYFCELDASEKLLTFTGITWEKKGDYSKWCKEQKQEEIPVEKK